MNFRNWAVVSFNDDTGLGRQALDMYEYLKLGYFLVVPSEKLSTKPLNSKNYRLLDPKCDRNELSKLLEGIEGLLVLERPHWHANLLSIAKDKGIKIVTIPNWEWFNGNDPLWKKCDLFLCTSYFTKKIVSNYGFNNSKYIGTHPVNLETLPERVITGCAKTFFHNAGLIDEDDRKSTKETIEAFQKVKNQNIKLIIRAQKKESFPEIYKDRRIEVRFGNLKSPSNLYCEGDVAIQPSKMEGNGFSIIEAKASGIPVITLDYPPMNEVIDDRRLLVKKKWFKRNCLPKNWIKHAHMRLPNIKDITRKIEWALQNDMSEISNSNRFWAEKFFDPSYVQNKWGKVIDSFFNE